MEIKYHTTVKGILAAEILLGNDLIASPDDILDSLADARLNGSDRMIIHEKSFHPDLS